ncbi:hypothetical protein MKK63_04205 [Methylobacterium sp. J-088]|uniref:hypothetical protein n=1 Tax=Methylobacterium sp. J-088 TaxID=2836664 RepID=UPI001FBB3818|nr:hypothetical protein [Methylobacterium sp. J-088]MCJ2061903.1 hypothetical protein [Methylobacterium sp. J-088]
MNVRERAAFNAGIEAIRQMALTTAITIEVRDDASRVQHQAAVAALQALAEGARDLKLEIPADPAHCISAVFTTGRDPRAEP